MTARGGKLRICYLAGGEVPGGIGTSLRIHAAVHDSRRYDLCYLWTSPGRTQREIESKGFPSQLLPIGRPPATSVYLHGRRVFNCIAPAWYASTLLRWVPRLAELLRLGGADLVYTNQYFHNLLGGLAGRMAGVPAIWHVRMVMSRRLLGGAAVRFYSALAARLAAGIACNSRATASAFTNAARSRLHVIYNRVPDWPQPSEGQIQRRRAEMGAGPDDFLVGWVGRISREKGLQVLLQAAERLKGLPRTRFAVIGSPAGREGEVYGAELHRFVAGRGLDRKVRFLGFRRDVRDLYPAMDVLCATSLEKEGFNYSLAEGLCAGIPCVASRCGGQAEVVEDGVSGVLYEPGDSAALAHSVRRLAAEEGLRRRMGRAARERFLRRFEVGSLMSDLESLYDSVLPYGCRGRRGDCQGFDLDGHAR